MNTASACAKTILFGEHAVVYGEPGIAVPLSGIRTEVRWIPNGETFRIASDAFGTDIPLTDLREGSGLRCLTERLKELCGIEALPPETLRIISDIPIASGLGSGAALSAAVVRAFRLRFGLTMDTQAENDLVYEIEKIYHGNPSGIDNTTVVYEQPVYFVKGQTPVLLEASAERLPLIVMDSGIRSRTVDVVTDVRSHYPENAPLIRTIGTLVQDAVPALRKGDIRELGSLMNRNHELLRELGVSCPELESIRDTALRCGAIGVKLTGAGRGGNLIALAPDAESAEDIRRKISGEGVHVVL